MITIQRNGDIHVVHNGHLNKTELIAIKDTIDSFSFLLPEKGSITLTGFAEQLRKLYPVLEMQASMLEDADFNNTYAVEVITLTNRIRRTIKALTASLAGEKIFRIYGNCQVRFTSMAKCTGKDSFIIPKQLH